MSPLAAAPTRQRFIELAGDQRGCPYIYGAKGEHYEDPNSDTRERVFDCSGLVTFCLYMAGGPDWRTDHNADRLFKDLPAVMAPKPGDLAFYGPPGGPAVHVVICYGNGNGSIIGANGGNSDCTSLEKSHQRQAFVKVDTRGPKYRKDFIGFRSLAQFLSDAHPKEHNA